MSARLRQVVIDSTDPEPLAAFWAAATGRRARRLDDVYVALSDPARRDARLLIQRVPARPKAAKNPVHIDLAAEDPEEEAARLVELGATILDVVDDEDGRWVVLADPQGNELCVLPPSFTS